MADSEVAQRFEDFCGANRFYEFVRVLDTPRVGGSQRLLPWQQDLWEAFLLQDESDLQPTYESALHALRVCYVHRCALAPVEMPILYGRAQMSRDYVDARRALFPCAAVDVFGGCTAQERRTAIVWRCSHCRAARDAWLATHPNPFLGE